MGIKRSREVKEWDGENSVSSHSIVWCRAVHTTEPKKKKTQKTHNFWSFLKVLNYKFSVSWDLWWQIMQIIIQNNTNLSIIANTFNRSWLGFRKHPKTCLHPSPTVDRVCANMETILNDHHLQAQSLKGVLLLNSTFFTRSASKMAQRMIRQQWETSAVLVF